MFSKHDQIRGYDDELLAAMDAEEARQEDHLELIASENYTSKRVMRSPSPTWSPPPPTRPCAARAAA